MMPPPSLPLPFLPTSPFWKKTVYSRKNICLSLFLFVCFIYYIIIIILDCILISLIDFFYHIPYVICRLMIRCVLLLRKYTYSLTIEVPNFLIYSIVLLIMFKIIIRLYILIGQIRCRI